MRVVIKPSRAVGEVFAPPSKSMSHRALIAASLSSKSRILNLGASEDIDRTLDCLEKLGARVKKEENALIIGGFNPKNIPENVEISAGESGSTLRFLIPLCMMSGKKTYITGTKRLMERPQSVYEKLSGELNIEFSKNDGILTVGEGLCAGEYEVSGEVSSQFITGLLFALSTLPEKSKLKVSGKLESASYIDLTTSAMCEFGRVVLRDGNTFEITPDTTYKSTVYTVEGDWSNAAFLDAFNLIGGNVKVLGLNENSLQGDRVYLDFYKRLKEGFDTYDLADCPDLAPILFALAALLNGAEFTNTKRLKIKESDRAEAMREELLKVGCEIEVYENRVVVPKAALHPPAAPVSSHNDHRIAMAMSVVLSVLGGEIIGAEAVAKSFPDYFKTLEALQIGIEYYA